MKNTFSCFLLALASLIASCSYSSSDYTADLGSGYTFVSESNTHQIISGPHDTAWVGVVPCTVEKYEYDDKNVIVKQKVNPNCIEQDLSKLPLAYWIIDKKRNMVHGPLDSLTFLMKRKELMVSSSLEFNK